MNTEYLAIYGKNLIARGNLETIVRKTKEVGADIEPIVLAMNSFKRIELNWYGDVETVLGQLPNTLVDTTGKRGRPKLGVTSKEVTLLPRHWEWLATQRGGASVTLRRLVDQAIKNASLDDIIKIEQNQLYSLMNIFADEPGFEEASRALYRNSKVTFEASIQTWPKEIKQIIMEKFDAIGELHSGQSHD